MRFLRKLFRRDSTAHMHPRKRDAELISVQRMEKILRERNITSKPFHVKVCERLACDLYVQILICTLWRLPIAVIISTKYFYGSYYRSSVCVWCGYFLLLYNAKYMYLVVVVHVASIIL